MARISLRMYFTAKNGALSWIGARICVTLYGRGPKKKAGNRTMKDESGDNGYLAHHPLYDTDKAPLS